MLPKLTCIGIPKPNELDRIFLIFSFLIYWAQDQIQKHPHRDSLN